jgi:PIN domain nuclease of toxin-antitoxin system
MRLLLDTHAFLWWLDGNRRLPKRARALISEDSNIIFVSAASAWEISTKSRLGKLPGAMDVAADLPRIITAQAFTPLDITILHAQRAGHLPGEHRDPFDRMLAAQAQIEDLPIISNDEAFASFGVERIW